MLFKLFKKTLNKLSNKERDFNEKCEVNVEKNFKEKAKYFITDY